MEKICPYPFARMEIRDSNQFVPCCSSWLKPEFFQLDHGDEPWNSPAATQLRQSILDGDYKYCKTEICNPILVDPTVEDYETVNEAPINAENRAAISEGLMELPEGPTSYSIISDPRCNLSCPSCRKEKVLTVSENMQKNIERVDLLIEKHKSSLEVLKLSGDGELFFSPWLKSIVKRLNPEEYPRFRHIIVLSNGLLFNEKTYNELLPGSQYIKKVSISVDAGNSDTYTRVRGGSWERLVNNLHWMGEMKKQKRFSYFQLNFTLRRDNYRSVPEFIELGKRVGAGNVKFTAFFDYPESAIEDYLSEAIHLPSHPEHSDLRNIWESHVQNDSFVRWSLPEPQA